MKTLGEQYWIASSVAGQEAECRARSMQHAGDMRGIEDFEQLLRDTARQAKDTSASLTQWVAERVAETT